MEIISQLLLCKSDHQLEFICDRLEDLSKPIKSIDGIHVEALHEPSSVAIGPKSVPLLARLESDLLYLSESLRTIVTPLISRLSEWESDKQLDELVHALEDASSNPVAS